MTPWRHWPPCGITTVPVSTTVPKTRHDTSYGEKLQAMAELDLDDLLTIEPPRGYRRD